MLRLVKNLEEIVNFHFAPQGAAADAQDPGGGLPIAPGLVQGFFNGHAFAVPALLVELGRGRRLLGAGALPVPGAGLW